jgi:mannose-6-phosphate isomerase-like protein (cupin superfamily)
MSLKPINFAEKLTLINQHWSPKVIAEMNDYQFKLVKVKGEFLWHNHPETDEVFIVIQGSLIIAFTDHQIELNAGEMYVVPKRVEHKPIAQSECQILLIEPKGVVNTGNTQSELTAAQDVWI